MKFLLMWCSRYEQCRHCLQCARLILVNAVLAGPTALAPARLALDTGATNTLIRTAILKAVGYNPENARDRHAIVTGSGIENAPRIRLQGISALGEERTNLLVTAHDLPPSSGVDGLLGLDFLRDRELTLDFRRGLFTLR